MAENEEGRGEKEAQEIAALIGTVERDTAEYLIGMLQAIINEQVQTRSLKHETGTYIIDAVKDQAHRKGWVD